MQGHTLLGALYLNALRILASNCTKKQKAVSSVSLSSLVSMDRWASKKKGEIITTQWAEKINK